MPKRLWARPEPRSACGYTQAMRCLLSSPPRAARDPKTVTDPQTVADARTRLAPPWSVVVWDDPVNLMSYVVYVFQRLFGFSDELANKKMMEVHNDGRSTVTNTDREQAEFYVSRLHAYGLQATMERAQDS